MEDIRRMEDETQRELEEVVNPVGVALVYCSPPCRCSRPAVSVREAGAAHV